MKLQFPKIRIVLITLAIAPLLLTSCTRQQVQVAQEADYYTCPMHPSVRLTDPKAKCPICGMSLVPIKPNATAILQTATGAHQHAGPHAKPMTTVEQPAEFVVAIERQQQIGVTYASAEIRPLHLALRTTGVVATDQRQQWDYASRTDGFIQKLYVFSRGDRVKKNQPLLSIYSPDLLATQREFVSFLKIRDEARKSGSISVLDSAERMLHSARRRLLLWNITEDQITELEKKREPQDTLILYSPFDGVVQDLPVDQGRRISIGEHLVEVADLSAVWVWADFYETELPLLTVGLPVAITMPSNPEAIIRGKIQVIDPFINETKRTGRVRIDLDNLDFRLHPEMYVDVRLDMDFGQGLVIPVNTVLPTGAHHIVFVEKGSGRLEPRFVELGRKFGDFYSVKSGLYEGERVVSSANFLIDAESKIQGALKSW